ncbi:MAG: hypothetical protein AAF573_03580 [Bacteroidota bacterium]
MKKTMLLLVLISTYHFLFSQNEDLVLLGKGNALYEMIDYEFDFDGELENLDTTTIEGKIKHEILNTQKENILKKSLYYFEELMEEFPESDLYFRAMNNAASVSYQLGDDQKAIKYYNSILGSRANDKEEGGVGSGIMAEQYALYKNGACKRLAEIYIERKEFKKAIKCIKLTEKYPYRHFCGNAYATNDIYIATLYTRSYKGMGDIKRALNYSLPHIFDNGLASNEELVELTVQILKENFDSENVVAEFEKACAEYYSEKKKRKKYEWTEYFITFLDTKIELPFYELRYTENAYEVIEKHLKESYFKKLITK